MSWAVRESEGGGMLVARGDKGMCVREREREKERGLGNI